MLFKCLGQLLKRAIAGNSGNGCSRHHSLAHKSVGKLEDSMDQAAFFRTKMTAVARNVDKLPQLGFCITGSMFRRWVKAEESDRSATSPVESTYGPLKHSVEKFHREGNSQSNFLSQRQSKQFWRLLAQYDMQDRDDRKCNSKREP